VKPDVDAEFAAKFGERPPESIAVAYDFRWQDSPQAIGGPRTLGELVTVESVAKRAKWEYRRMLRHLERLHVECGGMLLINVGTKKRPRYVLSLEKLKRLMPQWAEEVHSLTTKVDDLSDQADASDELVREAHRSIGKLVGRVEALERRRQM
jgi:hypothetical protein